MRANALAEDTARRLGSGEILELWRQSGHRRLDVLVPTQDRRRTAPQKLAPRQGDEARRIEAVLSRPEGQALYRRRQQMVEPVFAHIKCIRRTDRLLRRGLAACQAEWQLIAASHNLLKLWRAGLGPVGTAIPGLLAPAS